MQATVDYPRTAHRTGGQTHCFIHIHDTVRCIQIAVEHPPEKGAALGNAKVIIQELLETARALGRPISQSRGKFMHA